MSQPASNPQALIQRLQLLVQANRYSFLRKSSNAKLIAQVANKS
jgi:hypothetical protein